MAWKAEADARAASAETQKARIIVHAWADALDAALESTLPMSEVELIEDALAEAIRESTAAGARAWQARKKATATWRAWDANPAILKEADAVHVTWTWPEY